MAFVFQYGSNMLESRINSENRLKGKAKLIGVFYTDSDYEFDFPVYSITNKCAAASITLGGERKIWGMVYKVPDRLIERKSSGKDKSFDEIEGEGANYKRENIKVRYPDGRLFEDDVITYVTLKRQENIKTSQEYAGFILNGLRDNLVPSDYIEYIKGQIFQNNPHLKEFIESQ